MELAQHNLQQHRGTVPSFCVWSVSSAVERNGMSGAGSHYQDKLIQIFRRLSCFCLLTFPQESRDSSVGIALGYGLDDRGSRFRFPAEAGNFSLHHCVQNGSEAHPASCPMGTRGSFHGGVKLPGREADSQLHLVSRSRTREAILPLPQYASMAWCSVKKAQGHIFLQHFLSCI
jgi:hypothetical protein